MICDETAPLSLHRQAPIPDAEPAQAFDDLTVLAAQICGTPIAIMTLVDENRHRVEVCVGIDGTVASRQRVSCAHDPAGQPVRSDRFSALSAALDLTAAARDALLSSAGAAAHTPAADDLRGISPPAGTSRSRAEVSRRSVAALIVKILHLCRHSSAGQGLGRALQHKIRTHSAVRMSQLRKLSRHPRSRLPQH
jgi:hypothetical protein